MEHRVDNLLTKPISDNTIIIIIIFIILFAKELVEVTVQQRKTRHDKLDRKTAFTAVISQSL